MVVVEPGLLAVDPAVAQRHRERVGVGDPRTARARFRTGPRAFFLRDLEPDAGGGGVLPGQPGLPGGRVLEAEDGKIFSRHAV